MDGMVDLVSKRQFYVKPCLKNVSKMLQKCLKNASKILCQTLSQKCLKNVSKISSLDLRQISSFFHVCGKNVKEDGWHGRSCLKKAILCQTLSQKCLKNASKMSQKCFKNFMSNLVSKMSQKCLKKLLKKHSCVCRKDVKEDGWHGRSCLKKAILV